MNVPHHWPSTKALSVYNVLVASQTNAMPLTHVLRVLQKEHLPRYDADDVQEGVKFLVNKGFAFVSADGVLGARHVAGPRRPVRLKRINDDADLELNP